MGAAVVVEGVDARVIGFWPAKMQAHLAEHQLPDRFLCLDLANLSQAAASSVDGLLGADFLGGKIVQLNFGKNILQILKSFTPGPSELSLPMRKSREAMLVPVQVNGGPRKWVRLDTGCASPLEWVEDQAGTGGTEVGMAIGLVPVSKRIAHRTISMGQISFSDMEIGLHSKPIFPGEQGLLGIGLLSRFAVVTVDTRKGRLYLQTKG